MSVLLKEYFIGVLSLGVLIAIALGVSHPRLKSSVTFGAGILIISAIMLPLVDIIKDIDIENSLDKLLNQYEYEGKTDDAIEAAFEDGVAEYIADRYGVDVSSVTVMADEFRLDDISADRIYVSLSGKAALLDYKKIEREIAAEFTKGGECEVSISIG